MSNTMIMCVNDHDNMSGLSHCRVCGLPLLDLDKEFTFLADNLAFRAEMGRHPPNVLLIGLGTVGASLVEINKTIHPGHKSEYSYLAIDTDGVDSANESNGISRLRLGALTQSAGTFCGIGQAVARSDPQLVSFLRRAGLNRKDDDQTIFFVAGIGGGIGSAASVLVEKCQQLNEDCHTVMLVILPGEDESFHNHLNAYFGLSNLIGTGGKQAADLVIAVRYDRIKILKGVGSNGQELILDDLVAAFNDLLINNLSAEYIDELLRVNQSLGVRLVIPCLALGRSIEIFGSLANILESAIICPANQVAMPAVLACHLLLRVPESQAGNFKQEEVNEQLWALMRRHFPVVKAISSSITYNQEQHNRIDACILLGGDSAINALFANEASLSRFRAELDKDIRWQTYGLSEESVRQASDAIAQYDGAFGRFTGEKKIKRARIKRSQG